MGCCCTDTKAARAVDGPDITQHVNYAKGMVLGVDDFVQEFAYLSGRDRWLAAELSGYGTTNGLSVQVEDTAKGPQIRVRMGAAVLPGGQLVCVPADRCASVNGWLARKDTGEEVDKAVAALMTSPPAQQFALPAYLTLCYEDCLTAMVPVPGEPCRADEDLMAPSRLADSFKLKLELAPPAQGENDAVSAYTRWLAASLAAARTSSLPSGDGDWLAAFRTALKPWFDTLAAAPPSLPAAADLATFLDGAAPADLVCAPEHHADALRTGLRFWVTELRPRVKDIPCAGSQAQPCLLLAKLTLPIEWIGNAAGGAWQAKGTARDVLVEEAERPWLASLRLLQEWITHLASATGGGAAPGSVPAAPPSNRHGITVVGDGNPFAIGPLHDVVVFTHDGSQDVALPAITPDLEGLTVTLKNASAIADKTVLSDPANAIDTAAKIVIPVLGAVTLACDGVKVWHVIARVA